MRRLAYLQEGSPAVAYDPDNNEDDGLSEFEHELDQVKAADDATRQSAQELRDEARSLPATASPAQYLGGDGDYKLPYFRDPNEGVRLSAAGPDISTVSTDGNALVPGFIGVTRDMLKESPAASDTVAGGSTPVMGNSTDSGPLWDLRSVGVDQGTQLNPTAGAPQSPFERLSQMMTPGARGPDVLDPKTGRMVPGPVIGPPVMTKPKWWQTALAAGIGGGAGWVNAAGRIRNPIDINAATQGILHPGYQGRLEEWQSRVMPVQQQAQIAAEQIGLQQKAVLNQANIGLKAGQTQAAIQHGAYWQHRAETEANRYTTITSGPNKGQIFDKQTGEIKTGPPTMQDLRDEAMATGADQQTALNYAMTVASGGKYTPPKLEKTPTETAAAAANEYQQSMAKMAAAGQLPAGAASNVNAAMNAIDKTTALSSQEKANAKAWLTARPSPASTGTNTSLRIEGFGQSREYPVVDTKNGNTLMYLSAADMNAANRVEPGRYAPAGPAAKASTAAAVFKDLHYNINTARDAINALETMDSGTRAALSYALRHTDPASAFQTFLTGTAATLMTPAQQEAVQALALLSENAMTLRTVAGMGAGSDDLRAAIQATIPSGKSPSKGYALGQLNKFEQVVNRLETGPLKLGSTKQQGNAPPADTQERNGAGRGGGTTPSLPAQAVAHLKEGHDTTFGNGQTWRLQNGRPLRIK